MYTHHRRPGVSACSCMPANTQDIANVTVGTAHSNKFLSELQKAPTTQQHNTTSQQHITTTPQHNNTTTIHQHNNTTTQQHNPY